LLLSFIVDQKLAGRKRNVWPSVDLHRPISRYPGKQATTRSNPQSRMMGIQHIQSGRKRVPLLLLPLACLTAVAASVLHAHAVPESAAVELEAGSGAGKQVLVSSEATNEATSKKKSQNGDQTDNPCGIWLAPSTIKGAGLGMFAGKDFQAEDSLLPTGDSVIGIVDISLHNGDRHHEAFLWDEYVSGTKL